jgi:hypothetical protein
VTRLDEHTTLNIPAHVYLQQLRALGAWWRLGSSAVDHDLLIQYAAGLEGCTVCEPPASRY